MNSGFFSRAATIIWPISRASALPSSTWRLSLARADWCPAVARPSTQGARAISSRQRATWASVRTAGTWTSISVPEVGGEQERPARRGRRVGLVHLVEVARVVDVEDVHPELGVLPRKEPEREVGLDVRRERVGVAGVGRALARVGHP